MIIIDSNIPIPTKAKGGRSRRFDLPVNKLEVEQSFVVAERNGSLVPYSIPMQRNILGMVSARTDKPEGSKYRVCKWVNPDGVALIRIYRIR